MVTKLVTEPYLEDNRKDILVEGLPANMVESQALVKITTCNPNTFADKINMSMSFIIHTAVIL